MTPHPERLNRSHGTKAPLACADGPAPQRGREMREGREDPEKGREASCPSCPFCRSNDSEVISLFGSQVMTMQCKCHACGSFFEASKY